MVDNTDSGEVLFGSRSGEARTAPTSSTAFIPTALSERPLSDYLPSSAHGSIVITSRSREVAERLIEYAEDILDIGAWSKEDAVALLSKKLKRG